MPWAPGGDHHVLPAVRTAEGHRSGPGAGGQVGFPELLARRDIIGRMAASSEPAMKINPPAVTMGPPERCLRNWEEPRARHRASGTWPAGTVHFTAPVSASTAFITPHGGAGTRRASGTSQQAGEPCRRVSQTAERIPSRHSELYRLPDARERNRHRAIRRTSAARLLVGMMSKWFCGS